MERFAAILTSRLEEVTDKYEDIDRRIEGLEDERVRNIYRVVDKIQEEYNELDDKITDLSEAVEEFTEAIRKIKKEAQL
nr:MAG TPA: nucleoporin [Caudoviricetes sp.]